MKELIEKLKITNFRGFSSLEIPVFGKVNLITGKNNSGKSSLLEAIRILVTRGDGDTIHQILNFNEELKDARDSNYLPDLNIYRNLFTNFPDLYSSKAQFVIKASGLIPSEFSEVSVRNMLVKRRIDKENGSVIYEEDGLNLFGEANGFSALEVKVGDNRVVLSIGRESRRWQFTEGYSNKFRCLYFDPFSSRRSMNLVKLWDSIALTDIQDEVVKALQLLSDDIIGVSMIEGDDPRMGNDRILIVRSNKFDNPLPLRTYGDGIERLFGIIISLCNAKNGILLVDEIENGLHHSVQTTIWETIFRLANNMNVQIFATTHSWDCVEAFQHAASICQEEATLIRLTRKNNIVLSTVFNGNELKIATELDIEMR